MENHKIEQAAAELILHQGVRTQLRAPWLLRAVGIKSFGLTVRAPYEGTMHRVAKYYLSTGITSDQLDQITHEQALALMMVHGKAINKAVACAWLNGYWAGMLFTRPLAWYIRWHSKPAEIKTVAMMLLLYGGVSDFIDTTRSVRAMKLTAPNLGQMKKQGS